MTATTLEDNRTVSAEAPQAPRTLTRADRCDRCNAQAFVVAQKAGLEELLMCGHHGRNHTPALVAQGFVISDFTHLLHEEAKSFGN